MKPIGRIAFSLGLIFSVLALGGCVANRAYRANAPVLHESAPKTILNYSLSFVEFDDLGEMFTSAKVNEKGRPALGNTELEQTITEIQRVNSGVEGADPIFVVFGHGWKNNASDSSGNVWGFRSELQSIAEEVAFSGSQRPVMGIYIGWRGAVVNVPIIKEFTFWNRKDAAARIPGAQLTEALRRITLEAKSNSKAICVVVGHSFGGLITE